MSMTKQYLHISVYLLCHNLIYTYFQGLKDTLASMDIELPREPDSISNRQQLLKALHIEKLVKKNKVICVCFDIIHLISFLCGCEQLSPGINFF